MISVIPQPFSLTASSGQYTFCEDSGIQFDPEFEDVFETLRSELRRPTGFEWGYAAGNASIRLQRDAALQGEAYELRASDEGVVIRAGTAHGAFNATRTLLQLLPPSIFGANCSPGTVWSVPYVTIKDEPRFSWRGSHFDVSRHFFSKEFILRYIDLLALHKLSVLHLHLTDDQGWRMEIKRYPRLTEIGSRRSDTMLQYDPPLYSGNAHDGFYSQEDLCEIVAYARRRFITVVPEIDMPGHVTAALAAYPDLGNTSSMVEVSKDWGVINSVLNVSDETVTFFQNVLDEVIEIFPSEFIHIGGDECPKDEWRASPDAQARMMREGLESEEELQSWFIRQMEFHLRNKGRRLIGWSEILEGGLAPVAALMVWLGADGAVEAVRSGHDVVMAQSSHLYFDYGQDPQLPNATSWLAKSTLSNVYSYNPIPEGVSAEEAKHVLGLQYQVWTEYIPTEARFDHMVFPRACAAAEIAWTQADRLDFSDFQGRLSLHLERLDSLGVRYAVVG